jgi:hypothetical protein
MGLPKKNFEKKISFPKKCVEVWVFDGIAVHFEKTFLKEINCFVLYFTM